MAERRVAVVTGGAGAIGGAIVAALAASGHDTVSLDQTGDPPVDLGQESEVRAAAGSLLDRHGRCDVLVHAAAAFGRADLASVDLAAWRHVQAVNVESALLLAQAFAPGMATRGFGRIIFVVSDTVLGATRRGHAPVRDQQGSAGGAGPDARGRARRRRDRGDLRGARADGHADGPARPACGGVRSGQGAAGTPPARWSPRTWPPPWPSSPRTRRPRSPARRCAPTAA